MKQFIVLTVVLLAVQSIQGGTIVDDKCTCADTLNNTYTKAQLIEKLCACIERIGCLNAIANGLKCDNEHLAAENAELTAANSKLNIAIQQERDARAAAEKAFKEAQITITTCKSTIDDLKKKLTLAQQDLLTCNQQLEKCKAEGNSHRTTIAQLNATIKQLQENLERCRQSKEQLRCQLEECDRNLTICKNKLAACQADCDALRNQIKNDNIEIDRLEKSKIDCENSLNSLRCALDAFLKAAQETQNRISGFLQSAINESTGLKSLTSDIEESQDLSCNTPCEA